MKKIIIIVLFCPVLLFGQDFNKIYYNTDWEVTSKINSIYYRTSDFIDSLLAFDGKIEDRYALNNQLEMIGYYKNGKKNGEFIFYYPNGDIRLIANYLNNYRNGNWREFYPNGCVKIETEYVNNLELLIQLNDSSGNSVINDNKFRFKQDGFKVKGQILDCYRNGRWKITSEKYGVAKLTYEKGELIKGVLKKDEEVTTIYFEGAFPIILEPVKFFNTENLILERGAILKNNYALEGIHRNKYLSAKKITIDTKEELESFIKNEFELTNLIKEETIKIKIIVEDSKPVNCITQPIIANNLLEDLNLIIGIIEKLNFMSQGSFEMDYKIELEEELNK